MHTLYKLFFSPRGRISRRIFAIGIISLLAFSILALLLFTKLGASMIAFYAFLAFFFLALHIMMSLYGKRLHDLDRSLWPLIGMIMLMIFVLIAVGLKFGGIEYFETVMAHPEYSGDEDAMKKTLEIYQARLDANMPQARLYIAIAPVVFSAWLALAPGQKEENRYGPPPNQPNPPNAGKV